MTIPAETEVIIAAPPVAEETASYVDWAAIIAGIVLASAISLVLLTFGAAIGLNFANFRAGTSVAPIWIAIAAASWLLWVEVSSFMAGAYLTGRLRKRHGDASEEESDIRDGAHGLLVWAGALVIGGILAVGGIGAAANAIGSAASTAINAASNLADDATGALDPNAYYADLLLRPAPGTTAPAGTDSTAARAEAGRIFAQGVVSGSVSDADRTYLGQLVAANTGLPPDQASARVTEVMTAIDNAKAAAADAAEKARRTAVLAAFLTAASLLVSAAGAFWAAQMGGNHRDKGTWFADVFRRL